MIANLVNTLVGLGLANMAIFPDATGLDRDRLVLIAAVATIVLALWARRSGGESAWHSSTTTAAGALLLLLEIARHLTHVSDVLMFWGILWVGLISSTVSLWAALYRPPQAVAGRHPG
jgi:hypothetical protein